MDSFDKQPVVKAQTDIEILSALQGVEMVQADIRAGRGGSMELAFLKAYYDKLPEEVARRLTEIDAETIGNITKVTGLPLSRENLSRFVGKVTGDAAFAQVIRAANVYRARLGFDPLGPDGKPKQAGEEGTA